MSPVFRAMLLVAFTLWKASRKVMGVTCKKSIQYFAWYSGENLEDPGRRTKCCKLNPCKQFSILKIAEESYMYT